MMAVTSSGIWTLVLVFATSQVSAFMGSAHAQCTEVSFPDIMDIRNCINGSLTFCKTTKDELRESSRSLAKCLMKSLVTANFFKILLRGLGQAMFYGMQVSLPGSTLLASPVVHGFTNLFRRPKVQHKIIFTSRPCNETVKATFPDFLGIGDCILPEHFMCTRTGWMNLRTQALASFLSMVVCAMRKLPFFSVLFLLKDMMCSGFQMLQSWFQKIRVPIMMPIMNFFDFIFQCNPKFTTPPSVDTKFFGFNAE